MTRADFPALRAARDDAVRQARAEIDRLDRLAAIDDAFYGHQIAAAIRARSTKEPHDGR